MSQAAFLYATDGTGVVVIFDAVLSETHTGTAQISEHAVEEGSPVGDNVRADPFTFAVEAEISLTPIRPDLLLGRGVVETRTLDVPRNDQFVGGLSGALESLFASIPIPAKPSLLSFSQPFDPILEAQQQIEDWKNAGALLGVTTLTQDYRNMVVTNFVMKRTQIGTGSFLVELRQIRIVSTLTTTAPVPAEPRGSPKKAAGSQSTEQLTNEQIKSQASSLLFDVQQSVKGLFK